MAVILFQGEELKDKGASTLLSFMKLCTIFVSSLPYHWTYIALFTSAEVVNFTRQIFLLVLMYLTLVKLQIT